MSARKHLRPAPGSPPMPLSSASSQPFIEQETLVLTVERKPTITQLDGNGRRMRKVRPIRPLPHTGAGVVRVQPIGGRLTLRPSDELAARALGATRAASSSLGRR